MAFNHEKLKVYQKEELSQILRMLVGLRRSWLTSPRVVRDERSEYGEVPVAGGDDGTRGGDLGERVLFNHEKLDVYRVSIG